ncbi:hypothetical protein ACTRXD_14280 [Nitrospira sp. T9]|uniref:hypothetical protein n=1 Tax=unclassified Nitrospira TaxID=2652172 RepID=UPI003F9D0756
MKRPKVDMWSVVLGIFVILLMNASHLPMGVSGSGVPKTAISAETVEQDPTGLNKEPPVIPPIDPEMVVEPDIPPNPEAVVTPPVVDPEMAVDPTTRQPMTEEKLEQITPEELEKNPSDEK